MTKERLFDLVRELSLIKSIPNQVIVEGLNSFSRQERDLFVMLTNYINGNNFKKKIRKGDL